MIMKRVFYAILLGVPIYFISWTVGYVFFVGWNFKYFFNYMYLSWTSPGEIPSFIQVFALGLTLVMCLIILLRSRTPSRV